MNTVPISEVRKNTRVRLRNGWEARVLDNTVKAHTRTCEVFGLYTEMGSVYTTDIVQAQVFLEWHAVEHTANQIKAANARSAMGF